MHVGCAVPPLQHVLALLRLANHDSDVFYKFKQVLIDKIVFPYCTELVQMDVRGDIEKVRPLCRSHRTQRHSCVLPAVVTRC